jgi:uncharacterized membrane protein YgcG
VLLVESPCLSRQASWWQHWLGCIPLLFHFCKRAARRSGKMAREDGGGGGKMVVDTVALAAPAVVLAPGGGSFGGGGASGVGTDGPHWRLKHRVDE